MSVAKVTLNGNVIVDMTDATAAASDITAPKTAYIADGSKATGTGSGGGSTNELIAWLTGELNVIDLTGLTTFTRVVRYITAPSFTVNAPDLLELPSMAFQQSRGLTQIYCPKVASFGSQSLYNSGLTTLVAPSATSFPANFMNGSTELLIVDVGTNCGSIGGSAFSACSKLATLVLRKSSGVVSLSNTIVFGSTPFASGGAGGTIYIPKVLYDALGTGTNDYKATTNWSTVDGYGTITWAQIEGSQYENYYADGTAIT